MRVAVTGATGFIGRHVLFELTRHAVDVAAVVRHTGTANTATFSANVNVVALDVHDATTPPDEAFELLGRPDVLIHLSWGGLPHYRSLHHIELELPMHYRFLSGLVRAGLSALVVSGSCLEYGMQSGPLSEEMMTYPNNPYGYAKDALRRQLEFLQACQPFALAWARLFYLYGDGQSAASLWPQLMRAIEQGDEVFHMSGGEQLRDYLHVVEAAKVIVSMACNRADIGVVNICSGHPTSVRTLVEEWIKESGSTVALDLNYYKYPDYEPMAFWGDRKRLDHYLTHIRNAE